MKRAESTEQDDRGPDRARFIRRYGVLGWGLACGLLFPFVVEAQRGLGSGEFDLGRALVLLPISLPAFLAGGWFWGAWVWDRTRAPRHEGTAGGALAPLSRPVRLFVIATTSVMGVIAAAILGGWAIGAEGFERPPLEVLVVCGLFGLGIVTLLRGRRRAA